MTPAVHTNAQATRCRLFCCHYAGGSSSMFSRWQGILPRWIEVRPLELPGRGPHAPGAPITSFTEAIEHLTSLIRPSIDVPIAFYGHSVGALLAFELARWCRRQQATVVGLFVGARGAPHFEVTCPLLELDDVQLIHALGGVNDAVPRTLLTAERVGPFLPTLRADLAINQSYRYIDDAPLDCKIVAFAGSRDGIVRPAAVRAWSAHTRAAFKYHEVDGGHLFVLTARDGLLNAIADELEVALVGSAASLDSCTP